MNAVKKTIFTLFKIIFLDQTAITLTFPLLTLIFFDSNSRLFTTDTTHAIRSMWYGLCVSLPNIINLFFAPILSTLSDEIGRKKILLLEIFSAAFFTFFVGLGIFYGYLSLIFLGFIIRGAFSRSNPTALAIIGDSAPREKKILYMGYLQLSISLGAALGPVLGGYFAKRFWFNELNFSFPFFLAASLALINTAFTLFFMRETLQKNNHTHQSPRFNFKALQQVFMHKDILRISFILLLIQLTWSTYYQFIPPILKTLYHFNDQHLGWFIGMIAIWLALATSIGLHILHRFLNTHHILLIAVYLILLGFALTLLARIFPQYPILLWAGAIPIAMGDVISYSSLTALYSNAVEHRKQGKVMGISFIVVGLAWSLTGFVGGFLMSITPLLPLLLAPISVILALIFLHKASIKKLVLVHSTC